MAAVANEHSKRFHQGMSQMEKRYSGKWSPNMWGEVLLGRHHLVNIRAKKKMECLMNFFVVRIPCIVTMFIT
jgi:hypothetical protein